MGGDGNDTLYGSDGDDTLIGGTGVDYLNGGAGDDTYIFTPGDSQTSPEGYSDQVDDSQGNNRIVLNGVDPGSFAAHAYGQLLSLDISPTERIAIVNGVSNTGNTFQVGSEPPLTLAELAGTYSDSIFTSTGSHGEAQAFGGRGDDRITVIGGGARLSGGRGNDTLTASGGNNTYGYRKGDGADRITDGARVNGNYVAAGASHIVLGAGIAASDISLSTANGSLTLNFGAGTGDSLTIDGFDRLNAVGPISIDALTFADRSTADISSLMARGFDIGGTTGNDLKLGTSVADRFAASAGSDTLDGGAGSDTYNWGAGAGQDTLIDAEIGGTSSDLLRVDASIAPTEVYFARVGNDIVVKSHIGADQITLTNQSMGAGVESIAFADGTNLSRADISARLAHELTNGADRYSISTTAENIAALAGDDTVYGNLGDDTIDGGAGDDQLDGASGNDCLFGADGNDLLVGAAGDDALSGGAGDDTLQGGAGNDLLTGGTGNDLLDGGRGDDRYLFAGGFGFDIIDNASAGAGEHDTISFAADLSFNDIALDRLGDALRLRFQTSGEFLNITGFFLSPALTTIQFASGESFDRTNVPAYTVVSFPATPGDDVITLSGGDDYFDALAGDDLVYAGAGNDTVLGSAGSDVLHGQGGNDSLVGGADSDALYGEDGDDTLVGSLYSPYDGDALYGGAGNDKITGGNFVDAGAGDDFIDSPGAQITMGAGNDTVVVRNSTGIVVTDRPGVGETKTFKFADGITPSMLTFRAYSFTYDVYLNWPGGQLTLKQFRNLPVSQQGYRFDFASNGETLSYSDMKALMNRPTEGNDFIEGTTGNDVINGLGGNDEIYGLAGNDRLIGGGGLDTLYGGTGNDTLSGGVVMSGDGGLDTYYVLDPAAAYNTRVIAGADGGDVVIVDASVRPQDVLVRVLPNDLSSLVLQFVDAGGVVQRAVTLVGEGVANGITPPVAEVRFQADPSTVWTAADLFRLMTIGGAQDDNITGLAGRNNVLLGNGGDDTLIGGTLADTLDGGSGNDFLSGGAGADTYIFGNGYGSDRVVDIDGSATNLLQLKADVSVGAVRLVRTGQDSSGVMRAKDSLVLLLPATGDQIWIDQFFQSASAGTLAAIRFADGTMWSYNTIAALAGASISGGADTQYGTSGDDIFYVDNALDAIVESVGGGIDTVRSTVSYRLPTNVENIELSGVIGINATGNASVNTIKGNAGSNVLDGGGGDPVDHFIGGAGDDTFRVVDNRSYAACNDPTFFYRSRYTIAENPGEGYDTLVTNELSADLPGNVERLVVAGLVSVAGFVGLTAEQASLIYNGNTLDNVIDLSAVGAEYSQIKRVINGGAGADTMIGSGGGDETFMVDDAGDVVVATGTNNTTVSSSVDYTLGNNLKNLTLTGTAALTGTGNSADNVIDSASDTNANVLRGLNGNDTYVIGLNDTVLENADEGRDIVIVKSLDGQAVTTIGVDMWQNVEGAGLDNAVGALNVTGNRGDNTLLGNDSSNQLFGLDGNDVLSSLDISKVAYVALYGGYQFSTTARAASDVLDGGAGNDTINAYSGSATIRGGSGDDRINLLLSNAFVDGGSGNDTISGGVAYDRVVAGVASDHDVLSNSNGIALLLSAGTDASALTFTRDANASTIGYGNASDSLRVTDFYSSATSSVVGSAVGSIAIDGGVVLDHVAIVAAVGQGDLRRGTSGNDLLIAALGGGALNGGSGNDTLIGQSGDDRLNGGSGSDTYVYAAGFGNDTIDSFDTGTSKIDSIRFQSSATDAVLTREGNDLLISVRNTGDSIRVRNHFIAGYQIDNITFGDPSYAGSRIWNAADIRAHLSGDHAPQLVAPIADAAITRGDAFTLSVPSSTFVDGDTGDVLTYRARLANGDALPTWLSFDAASRTFSGNSTSASLGTTGIKLIATDTTGVSATDVFNLTVTGMATMPPAPTLYGTPGDDTLAAGPGNETIYAGAGNDVLIGGVGANGLYGEEGNDRLIGNGGADTMNGGNGNDTYLVDNAAQVVVEAADGGIDTIVSTIGLVLPRQVENLVLTGSANIDGTGNDLVNTITGNSGANVLVAGVSGGSLYGLAGNDTLVDGESGTVVTRSLVDSDPSLAVSDASGPSVESHIATKNRLARFSWYVDDDEVTADGAPLVEPSSSRVLSSIRSADIATTNSATHIAGAIMIGGTGDDTYIVNNAADVVVEMIDEGNDTIRASISISLAANVENLILIGDDNIDGNGNGLANTITGNNANNCLRAGFGGGTLYGRGGNDTLQDGVRVKPTMTIAVGVDDIDDAVWDVTNASQSVAGIESAIDSRTASSAAGLVTRPIPFPVAKAAILFGGTGDDDYLVNLSDDVVVEEAGEGDDTIIASVSYALAANVEHLILTGGANLNGSGNDQAHTLTGNTGNNVLTAGSGGGVLDGNGGDDTLIGGTGADTFVFGAGRQNHVTIENSDDRDVLQLAVGITADQIWASRVGNDLELGTYGTGSTAIFADWYGDPQHALSRFQMSDGTALMAAQVQGLVQAMASFSAPASTSLPSIGPMHSLMNQAVLPTVANNTWGI